MMDCGDGLYGACDMWGALPPPGHMGFYGPMPHLPGPALMFPPHSPPPLHHPHYHPPPLHYPHPHPHPHAHLHNPHLPPPPRFRNRNRPRGNLPPRHANLAYHNPNQPMLPLPPPPPPPQHEYYNGSAPPTPLSTSHDPMIMDQAQLRRDGKKQRPSKRARQRMRKKMERLRLEQEVQHEANFISSESGYDTTGDHSLSVVNTPSHSPQKTFTVRLPRKIDHKPIATAEMERKMEAPSSSLDTSQNKNEDSAAVPKQTTDDSGKPRERTRCDSTSSITSSDMSLKRLLKDLHRCDVSITRHQALLMEHIDEGLQQLQEVISSLREGLRGREEDLAQELASTRDSASTILKRRKEVAHFLRQAAEKAHTMEDAQVAELKHQIKQFVTDRKVDEEIGSIPRFQADLDDLLPQIMGFGKVVTAKHHYTAWEDNPEEMIEMSKRRWSLFSPATFTSLEDENELSEKSPSQESIEDTEEKQDSVFTESTNDISHDHTKVDSVDMQNASPETPEDKVPSKPHDENVNSKSEKPTRELELTPKQEPQADRPCPPHKPLPLSLPTSSKTTFSRVTAKYSSYQTSKPALSPASVTVQVKTLLSGIAAPPTASGPSLKGKLQKRSKSARKDFNSKPEAKSSLPPKNTESPLEKMSKEEETESAENRPTDTVLTPGPKEKEEEGKEMGGERKEGRGGGGEEGWEERREEGGEVEREDGRESLSPLSQDIQKESQSAKHSPMELAAIQARVRASLQQQGVFLYDPFTGAGPPKGAPSQPSSTAEFSEITSKKKKTPTQLRRERKKRQKERERRQREMERRGREGSEKMAAGGQDRTQRTYQDTSVVKRNDSSSDSTQNLAQSDQASNVSEQKLKKKKKSKTKAHKGSGSQEQQGQQSPGLSEEARESESGCPMSSDSENGQENNGDSATDSPQKQQSEKKMADAVASETTKETFAVLEQISEHSLPTEIADSLEEADATVPDAESSDDRASTSGSTPTEQVHVDMTETIPSTGEQVNAAEGTETQEEETLVDEEKVVDLPILEGTSPLLLPLAVECSEVITGSESDDKTETDDSPELPPPPSNCLPSITEGTEAEIAVDSDQEQEGSCLMHHTTKPGRPIENSLPFSPDTLSPSDDISIPEPSNEISIPEPSDEISLPEPSNEISIPEPSDEIPIPEPSNEISIPEPSDEIPIPEASNEISIPEAHDEISTPEASNEISIPETSNEISNPGPSNSLQELNTDSDDPPPHHHSSHETTPTSPIVSITVNGSSLLSDEADKTPQDSCSIDNDTGKQPLLLPILHEE